MKMVLSEEAGRRPNGHGSGLTNFSDSDSHRPLNCGLCGKWSHEICYSFNINRVYLTNQRWH
jgi:hypothetical protein